MAAGEKPDTASSTESRTAESASQNHTEERNDSRILTSTPTPDLSQQKANESSQSGLFHARIASKLTASQKTGTDDYTQSSEDLDFEALSNFEDTTSQDGTTSDSDETNISDFDELEGVSEGELSSFSDQSQSLSPPLLDSTKTTTLLKFSVAHESAPTSFEVAVDNVSAIRVEPMDTSCEDFDEGNCHSDEDGTMCSPMLVCRDMNSPSGQISSQKHHSSLSCTQGVGDKLTAALPDSGCDEQHIPGTHEEAKKPKDEGDDDTMSHLSDKEWTELSLESPVFMQGGYGNDTLVGSKQCCNVGTAISCTQRCILPTVGHGETHGFTNSAQSQNNSAFDCLEDYEDTLSQSEDETICVDALVTPANHNSTQSSDTICSDSMLTRTDSLCENAEVRGMAPEPIATCSTSPLTHDITDEDFCWEE